MNLRYIQQPNNKPTPKKSAVINQNKNVKIVCKNRQSKDMEDILTVEEYNFREYHVIEE